MNSATIVFDTSRNTWILKISEEEEIYKPNKINNDDIDAKCANFKPLFQMIL